MNIVREKVYSDAGVLVYKVRGGKGGKEQQDPGNVLGDGSKA